MGSEALDQCVRYPDPALIIHVNDTSLHLIHLLPRDANFVPMIAEIGIRDDGFRLNHGYCMGIQEGEVALCDNILQLDRGESETYHADLRDSVVYLGVFDHDCSFFVLDCKDEGGLFYADYSLESAVLNDDVHIIRRLNQALRGKRVHKPTIMNL